MAVSLVKAVDTDCDCEFRFEGMWSVHTSDCAYTRRILRQYGRSRSDFLGGFLPRGAHAELNPGTRGIPLVVSDAWTRDAIAAGRS